MNGFGGVSETEQHIVPFYLTVNISCTCKLMDCGHERSVQSEDSLKSLVKLNIILACKFNVLFGYLSFLVKNLSS
jgi:hypothetical protein